MLLNVGQGAAGAAISATATGLAGLAAYHLTYADSEWLQGTRQCGEQQTIAGLVTTDNFGNVSANGTIPNDAPSGPAEVWLARDGNPADRGPSAPFVVLGEDDCDDDQGVLYRGGSATNPNFTPRPDKDVGGYPNNGLSTYVNKAKACWGQSKVQVLMQTGLAAVANLSLQSDPADPEHIFLQGDTLALHQEWAATRSASKDNPHRLTVGVSNANSGFESCP